MNSESVITVKLEASEAQRAIKRFIHAAKDARLFAGIAELEALDEEQEMRARNLMTVRALPCDRE